jgi:hypothetical protein
MQAYNDKSGNSGISAYEIGSDFIKVKFKFGTYLYTYESAGREAVEQMKNLAKTGNNLNTFINQHVKNKYAAKM